MDETRGMSPSYQTRTCPRCGAELYADMKVCYGCLYDFTRGAGRPEPTRLPEPTPAADDGATLDLVGAVAASAGEVGLYLRTPSVDVWTGVPPEGVTIGRGDGCDIVLHSRAVSRRHLRLVPTPDGMEASDLGATNPTRYRGRDLRGTVVVPYGDAVDLCGCLLGMTGPS